MLYLLCIGSIRWFPRLILLHMRMIEKGESIDMYWHVLTYGYLRIPSIFLWRWSCEVEVTAEWWPRSLAQWRNVATWQRGTHVENSGESLPVNQKYSGHQGYTVSNTWEVSFFDTTLRQVALDNDQVTELLLEAPLRRIDMAHRCIRNDFDL